MATPAVTGTDGSFFELGEVRLATDSDFDHFVHLAENFDGWVKKYEKNGVTVWNKDTGRKTVKMLKVCGEFKDIPISTTFDVLLDDDYRKKWDEHSLEDYNVCMLDGNNDVGYYSLKCPPPLKNRDLVNQRSWRILPEEYVVFNHSITYGKFPPKKDFVRAVSYVTGFLLRSNGNGTKLIYVTQSDPRGRIPKWVINLVTSHVAPQVFRKLHAAALKYTEWKSKTKPDFKPWLYPEQNPLPLVDWRTLQQESSGAPLPPEEVEDDTVNGEEDDKVPDGLLQQFVGELEGPNGN